MLFTLGGNPGIFVETIKVPGFMSLISHPLFKRQPSRLRPCL
jgi:hypothetical protein